MTNQPQLDPKKDLALLKELLERPLPIGTLENAFIARLGDYILQHIADKAEIKHWIEAREEAERNIAELEEMLTGLIAFCNAVQSDVASPNANDMVSVQIRAYGKSMIPDFYRIKAALAARKDE